MDNDDSFDIFGDLNNLQKKITLPKDHKKDSTAKTALTIEYDEEFLDNLFSSSSNKTKKSANHTRKVDSKKENSKAKSGVAKENQSSTSKDQSINVENILSEEIDLEETQGPLKRCTRANRKKTTATTQNGNIENDFSLSTQSNSHANLSSPTSSPPKRGRRGRRSKNGNAARNNIAAQSGSIGQANMLEVLESMTNISTGARRQLIAEYAARAPQAGYIDLSSCVQPRVEGYICLDSDDEDREDTAPGKTTLTTDTPLNASFDADNPEISIKIRWNGDIQKFSLRKYQKFSHIIKHIAQRELVPLDEIVLNLKDRFVKPNDTPDSIDYKVYDFIDGRAMKLTNVVNTASGGLSKIVTNEHKPQMKQFQLKVQSEQMKRPIVIDLKKTDSLKILFIKCSEELNIPHSRVKLSFDGEPISPEDTPEQLDLEGGEIIDLRIKP